jgi:hypothetical protein
MDSRAQPGVGKKRREVDSRAQPGVGKKRREVDSRAQGSERIGRARNCGTPGLQIKGREVDKGAQGRVGKKVHLVRRGLPRKHAVPAVDERRQLTCRD